MWHVNCSNQAGWWWICLTESSVSQTESPGDWDLWDHFHKMYWKHRGRHQKVCFISSLSWKGPYRTCWNLHVNNGLVAQLFDNFIQMAAKLVTFLSSSAVVCAKRWLANVSMINILNITLAALLLWACSHWDQSTAVSYYNHSCKLLLSRSIMTPHVFFCSVSAVVWCSCLHWETSTINSSTHSLPSPCRASARTRPRSDTQRPFICRILYVDKTNCCLSNDHTHVIGLCAIIPQ